MKNIPKEKEERKFSKLEYYLPVKHLAGKYYRLNNILVTDNQLQVKYMSVISVNDNELIGDKQERIELRFKSRALKIMAITNIHDRKIR